ncbi:MAG: flagellar biosynthesis protein FlhF [Acidobacteriota bacterium]
MKVKTYRAPSIKEALEAIKKELGSDAFILSRREIKGRKVMGLFGKNHFEVTAAVDYAEPGAEGQDPKQESIETIEDTVTFSGLLRNRASAPQLKPVLSSAPFNGLTQGAGRSSISPREGHGVDGKVLLDEIRNLRSMIQSMPAGPAGQARLVPPRTTRQFSHSSYEQAYETLVSRGIAEELAFELVQLCAVNTKSTATVSRSRLSQRLAAHLAQKIQVFPGLLSPNKSAGPEVIALVGPTGVGKTTTVAKLAARAALERQLSVGLITLDTFRIAAVEQLKTYAEIIGIPTIVVEDVRNLDEAIQKFSQKDLILIDTPGRSPRELGAQQDLAEQFVRSKQIRKVLLLSATTKELDLADAIAKYQIFNPDCVVLTKFDETQVYGPVINELVRTSSPVAYVTVGQNVPKDIVEADAARIVNLALSDGPERWDEFVGTTPYVPTGSVEKPKKARRSATVKGH